MRFLYVLLISLLVVSCSSVPKVYLKNNDICGYTDSIFDNSKLKKRLELNILFDSLKAQTKVIRNDSLYDINYVLWQDGDIAYKEKNKKINITKWVDYDKDGLINNVEFVYLNGNSNIFKKTYYNKDGSIKKYIDYDKGYKICWVEAIAIVKKIAKRKIKKYGVTQFYAVHNNLNRGSKTKKALWFVGFMDGNDKLRKYEYKKGAIQYKIDGVTGKFLGTRHIITEHN